MNKKGLKGFLSARNVAIIGASERNFFSRSLINNLTHFGFSNDLLHLVNPNHEKLFGRPCWPNISGVPVQIDLAILLVSREIVPRVLKDCLTKGVSSVVVVASGFAERDEVGRRLQEEIKRLADTGSIDILGPNSMGFVAVDEKLVMWCSSLSKSLRRGNISAVFHSSGMLNLFIQQCADRKIGIRVGWAPGNETTIGILDCLRHAVEDKETSVIAVVLDHIGDPGEFGDLLQRAHDLEKPVVILRLGKSVKAMKAIEAHSGRLGKPSRAWSAFVRQKGAITVDTLDDLIESCVIFARIKEIRPHVNGALGLVTISGGDCSLLVDLCEDVGLNLLEPSDDTRAKISDAMRKHLILANPFDVEDLWSGQPEIFRKCLGIFAQDPVFQIVACRLNLPKTPDESLTEMYKGAAEAIRSVGKVPLFLTRASEQLDEKWFEFFAQLNVPLLVEYRRGLMAIKNYLNFVKDGKKSRDGLSRPPLSEPLQILKASMHELRKGGCFVPFSKAKALLQAYGIQFPSDGLVTSQKEALQVAEKIGYPVAIKLLSPAIPHKTEAGVIQVGLQSAADVMEAYERLMQNVSRINPPLQIEGVLVQRMVSDGIEIVAGIFQDPLLGPAILVGLGGIFVEVFNDVAIRVPPITHNEAEAMIRDLKASPMLLGARGRVSADIRALADVLVRLGWLAMDFDGELEALDINPIVVNPTGRGAVAVDTLILTKS